MRLFRLIALVMVVLAPACSSSVVLTEESAGVATPVPVEEPTPEAAEATAEAESDALETQVANESATELVSQESEDDEVIAREDVEEEAIEPTLEPVHEPMAAGFAVGQCYEGQISDAEPRPVSCSTAHIAEIIVVGELAIPLEVPFPIEARMKILVSQACARDLDKATTGLAGFVDTNPSRIWPDETQWDKGDRSYVCAVAFQTPVAGSLEALRAAAPEPTPRPTPTPRPDNRDLQLGHCYTEPALDVFPYVPVSCNTPHFAEVVHIGEFSDPAGTPNPGRETLVARAQQACRQAFLQRFGVPLAESTFRGLTLVSVASWDRGGRRYVCLIIFDDLVSSPVSALNPLTHGSRDSLYAIRPGTCLNGSLGPNSLSGDREIVDCSVPHNLQVFSTTVFDTTGPYPGDETMRARSVQFCDQTQHVVTINRLQASAYTRWPGEHSWNSGDATVICYVKHRGRVTTNAFG